jgi:hypothetical protein
MMNRLHRSRNAPPWAWGVLGAINGAAVALAAFGLAELAAAVNDPLFDAVFIMGPLLLGTAMMMGREGWPFIAVQAGLFLVMIGLPGK